MVLIVLVVVLVVLDMVLMVFINMLGVEGGWKVGIGGQGPTSQWQSTSTRPPLGESRSNIKLQTARFSSPEELQYF